MDKETNCSHCSKASPIVFSFTQPINKDADRTISMCARCTEVMLLNMLCFNSDLANKIFNYINYVPAPRQS